MASGSIHYDITTTPHNHADGTMAVELWVYIDGKKKRACVLTTISPVRDVDTGESMGFRLDLDGSVSKTMASLIWRVAEMVSLHGALSMRDWANQRRELAQAGPRARRWLG